jgi:hypothetical protein
VHCSLEQRCLAPQEIHRPATLLASTCSCQHASGKGVQPIMRWIKQGLVFMPSGQGGWMKSHAQMPVVHVRDDRLRIYFSTRPSAGMSIPTFIDVVIWVNEFQVSTS